MELKNYNQPRNNIFTVEEMMRLKLVGRIIDEAQFKNEFEKTLIEYSNLPPESLKLSKELIRSNIKGTGYSRTACSTDSADGKPLKRQAQVS